MPSQICQLCLNSSGKLVDSHIIPRAFYEEYAKGELVVVSEHKTHVTRIRKGLYGKFLCQSCESKFNEYDEPCVDYFKKGIDRQSLQISGTNEAFIISNAFNNKDLLHKFALTILWRASVCGREEFRGIKLGSYQEKIRLAVVNDYFPAELLSATGIMFWEYRGNMDKASMFMPYHLHRKSNSFKQVYGNFHCHDFGFPYGELLIRLGGDIPSQGYSVFNGIKSVIWSCNLNNEYPNLFCAKISNRPKIDEILQTIMAKPVTRRN